MLGKRGEQRGFFEADKQYLETVGKESFYGFLAGQRGILFRDEDFAHLYTEKTGRPSVAPSLLAMALVLQTYAGVSDQEAKERADYDVRWKVALGITIEEQPFAKSTLQLFRAQLVANEGAREVFGKSLALAKQHGFLRKNRKLRLALDTTNILGRGAVKDTYNLLGDGIILLLRQLAKLADVELAPFAAEHGYGRYVAEGSLKGGAELNWDDAKERQRFLAEIVADADRLLEKARSVLSTLAEGTPEALALTKAAEPLNQVLLQDIIRPKEPNATPELRDGVATDRMPSVHDPEMRHGRKSASKRFDGHKAQIGVDTEEQLITAVDVLPGNAPDSEQALAMVEQTEANTGEQVEETLGDCAYGSGATRQEFADADRSLVAKVPATRNGDHFPKTDFDIDIETESCVCPAGEVGIPRYGKAKNAAGERKLRGFRFAAQTCAACPLRALCVGGKRGRSIAVHPQEALLQQARALQRSAAFAQYRKARQAVEHRIARLVQLGIRQARYVGRKKTLFQLLMAATVANLTLLAGKLAGSGSSQAQSEGAIDASGILLALLLPIWWPLLRPIAPRTRISAPSQPRLLHPPRNAPSFTLAQRAA